MTESAITTLANPNPWLQLGVAGAALLILFVFVFMYMRNINNLCTKIDRLIDSNADSNKLLSTTLTQWNVEQKNNTECMKQIVANTQDTSSKLDSVHSKLDAMMNMKCRADDKEKLN